METVDDLTVTWMEGEDELVRELDKHVLTKGAWATVAFLYQDKDRKTGEFGPSKITVRRYKKMSGVYRQQSKFNISSIKQARELAALLERWANEATDDGNGGGGDEE
jgi:hypothetical protein